MNIGPNYETKYNELIQSLVMIRTMLKQYTLPEDECVFQKFRSTQDMAKYLLSLIGVLIPEEKK